jgi:hypothetical protein
MLTDEALSSRLRATIESLRYWVPTIADVAHIAERSSGDTFVITIEPNTPAACPVELALRPNGRFDITIGGETYWDRAVPSYDLFLPLLEAIAAGNVVQRHWESLATGAVRAVETIVTMADGSVWREGRTIEDFASAVSREATERRDRHFLPYRR